MGVTPAIKVAKTLNERYYYLLEPICIYIYYLPVLWLALAEIVRVHPPLWNLYTDYTKGSWRHAHKLSLALEHSHPFGQQIRCVLPNP